MFTIAKVHARNCFATCVMLSFLFIAIISSKASARVPNGQAKTADFGSASWSSDGRYFVYQQNSFDMGIKLDAPDWIQFDTVTGQTTKSRVWPLQPALSDDQQRAFEVAIFQRGTPSFIFTSPNGRYIVYIAQKPTNWDAVHWGQPIGIADLKTGQHVVTTLSIETWGITEYEFSIHWSGDSSAFTVKTVTGYGAYYVYYVTNFKDAVYSVKSVTLWDGFVESTEAQKPGILIGNDLFTIYGVYSISYDGTTLLLDTVGKVALWNTRNSTQNRIFDSAGVIDAILLARDDKHALVITQQNIQNYNLAASQATFTTSKLNLSSTVGSKQIVRALISPDGKHVAIISAQQNSDEAQLDIVTLPN